MKTTLTKAVASAVLLLAAAGAVAGEGDRRFDAMIARHARANNVPETLVHHVVKRETRYNPDAISRGNYGLIQIRHATARGLGYQGSARGLLDAETNLTYGVRYLAGAYRVAGGDARRADWLYRTGYYYAAKRKGMKMASLTAPVAQSPEPQKATSGWASLLGSPVRLDRARRNPGEHPSRM
jgi:soluble lytic murein transglycosylase-like protein